MKAVFASGMPTAPDVRRIEEAVGVPVEGQIVEWSLLAVVTNTIRDSHRFGAVIHAWRRKLEREHNVFLISEPGKGLKVATPDERIAWAAAKVRTGRRAIVRGSAVAATTDANRLGKDSVAVRSFLVDVPARLRLAEQCAPKTVKRV
jgi:hypothetical protein